MTDIVALQLPEDSAHLETDNRERSDAPDEWGRQSFPASDPPQNW